MQDLIPPMVRPTGALFHDQQLRKDATRASQKDHIGLLVESRSYMNKMLRIPLHASPEQSARLQALQAAFAESCNHLSPLVQKSRVWNRVALHHLAYKELRQKYPDMGSQMICNVICLRTNTTFPQKQNSVVHTTLFFLSTQSIKPTTMSSIY